MHLQSCPQWVRDRAWSHLVRLIAPRFLSAVVLVVGLLASSVVHAAPAARDQADDRFEPAGGRPFQPNLNGEWIGHAVAYSGYRHGQAPGLTEPNRAEILEDLRLIAPRWNLIRLYNADSLAERILNVITEEQLPLRVLLGVWLNVETGDSALVAANQANARCSISLAQRYPDLILGISVGNETQVAWSAHRMPPETLIHYIRVVRGESTVPVTTADDFNFWNKPESAPVADEIDFITTHIHPLWNGQTVAGSIDWLDQVWGELRARHPAKPLVLGEIGWATRHNPAKLGPGEQGTLMKGEVSPRAQAQFLRLLDDWVQRTRVTTFVFEAFDESWKGGGEASGPFEVEKHWGVFHEDRTPKESLRPIPGGLERVPTGAAE